MNNNITPAPTHKSNASLAWNVLKILLALGLVFFVLSKTDVAELFSTLQNASLFWLIVSGVLFVLLTLVKTLQYYTLMRGELSYSQVLNLIVWQNAVSNFFLAGAGILTYITTTRLEHEMKLSRSVTIFFLTKIGDLTAIWLALLISSRLVWSQIGILQIPVLVLLAGIGIVLAGFLLTILFRQRFVAVLDQIVARTGAFKIKLFEKGLSYLRGLASIKQNKILGLFGRLLLYSLIYLAMTISWIYANLAIFHLQFDVLAVVFVSIFLQLVSYFPISVFGGLGIGETSALYFWSFFGASQEVLAPALIGIRVVFYVFNIIPLIYLPIYSTFLKSKEPVHNEQ